MSFAHRLALAALLLPALARAQAPSSRPSGSGEPKVGPPRGTVIVVGGGSMGPEIYSQFIEAAGGPDALIIDVPNAGGGEAYGQDAPGTRAWKAAGAKNVHVLFTKDRKIADSDSFVAVIKKAGGVWFEGGRQFHLVKDYGGTKTEQAFRDVLARGGVVGGSSAGASILGDFLVRGAPSSNNRIMDYPGWQKGFAYLRGVGIDQHVVARERLPDLADSILTKYPTMLAISEDEGTAWVVRGDTGTIIGRSKAFVYGGNDPNDPGVPFLTLRPGDTYNLATRRVMRRAISDSPLTVAFVDSVFAKYADPGAGGATVLVAQDGRVLVDKSWGIPPQPRYMPTTTVPQFTLGAMSGVFTTLCSQIPEPPPRTNAPARDTTQTPTQPDTTLNPAAALTPLQRCVARQIGGPIGLHKTTATADGQVLSNVDELYRLEMGLENPRTWRDVDLTKGWQAETVNGTARLATYGAEGGRRSAFVRVPDRRAVVIVLTNDDTADAKGMAGRIADRLLSPSPASPGR
jgi:cyanophycinase